ncbi:hypothetical protein BB560_004721 [Smittium megazygosporum]|uniref:Pre-rRNA-processing protein TSR2 n=1 Tax=Smittium megazygosporum TaxID=133381 RepID=A0A2T9Z8F2_9FUNG|nr:hypothetical protein BB560_004721 [Smittium megazygosporum]
MSQAPPKIHPNKQAFIEGVNIIFRDWTALDMAVKNGWGGPDSLDKRDWFIDVIIDVFDKRGSKIDEDYIQDMLEQIMEDEFECILEDDSPYQVAKLVCQLFRSCIKSDYSLLNSLKSRSKNIPASTQPQPQDQILSSANFCK